MRTTSSRTLTIALTAAMIAIPAVQADILDDILGATTAARDRATEARNNAAAARDRATEARNYAQTARDNAATAVTTAAAARDTAVEMRDTMQAGLDALSDQIRDAIEEAIEDLEQDVADELEGRDAFVNGGGAEAFRQQLIGLLQDSEALLNALNVAAGMPEARVDFGRDAALLQGLSPRLLYPLHRSIVEAAPGFLDALRSALSRAVADVQVIAGALTTPEPVDGDLLDQELDACTYVLDHLAEIKQATADLNKFALGTRTLGALLKAAGTTEVQGMGGIWGWVNMSVKNNRVKKLGLILEGMAAAVSGLTSDMSTKTRYCGAIGIAAEARERDNKILANQELILKRLAGENLGIRP